MGEIFSETVEIKVRRRATKRSDSAVRQLLGELAERIDLALRQT